MLSGTLLLFLVPNFMTLFTIVSTLAAILVIYSWGMILVAYLVYRKKRQDLHETPVFKMPAGIVMSWISLVFFAFSVVIMVFAPDTLAALCTMPFWFGLCWWTEAPSFCAPAAIAGAASKVQRARLLATRYRQPSAPGCPADRAPPALTVGG